MPSTPVAHADDFGLGDLLGGAITGVGDMVGDTSAPATQAALEVSGQGFDHAAAAVGATTNSLAGLADAPGPEAFSAAALFQQFIYDPIHTAIEGWIGSPVGEQVDGLINNIAGQFLIGEGADGTAAHPDGGAGGLLFGDGGDGWDSTQAGVAGGAGGDAGGFFGNGGAGGDGGAGANGGDGGDGGSLFGIGGNGGDGGSGDTATGLPALGGAGGNAGMLGSHGHVGQAGMLPSGPPTGSTDGLTTTGTWLTDSDGRAVLLHGLNEVYKIAPYEPSADGFGDDDAAFLAANGFNVVRLGVIWAGVEPEPGVFNGAYLDSIEQTVQTLHEHGIHVILDMHQDAYSGAFGGEGAPAWAVQDGGLPNPELPFPLNVFFNPAETHAWNAFWSNADASDGIGLENHYAQMLEYVASHFKDNPNVAGFEIMNEPYSGSQTLPSLFGSPFFEAQQLTPFYDQAASAIRAVDPNTPVFFEPSQLPSTAGLPTHLGTVDAANTVYSFHAYCQFPLGPLGCLPNMGGVVSNAEAYATAHNIPAFMTEFGASSNVTAIAHTMQPADQNLIGWTEWAYTGHGDITGSPDTEGLVFDPNQPPTGDNVNIANLETLAQPYPQVVAGTPNSWSFDNGTFQFSYTTAMVDGSVDFAAGAQTTISTPVVEFPDGYQVTVDGGHVVSAANAPELVIASDAGATTVSVTVTATPSP
jgi:endoglycosylceramidase